MKTVLPQHVYKLPDPLIDLKSVETTEAFNASSSILYAMAEFGRDERQLAADALVFDPAISKKVIKALVKRQAWKRNDFTEAQPGKFHHEHRQLIVEGKEIPEKSQEILFTLSKRWGGKKDTFTYYGSYDVTPETLNLIADVAKQDGTILSEKVKNEDRGRYISIKESARQGIQWIQDRVLYGPTTTPQNDIVQKFLRKANLSRVLPTYHHRVLHPIDMLKNRIVPPLRKSKRVRLLEFQRINQHGITYQGWMDGGTSLIHSTLGLEGILANHTGPIATIETQAAAFDAFMNAAYLFPRKEKHFTRLAEELRKNVLEYFWMDDLAYFGMGVDRDNKDKLRLIQTLGANGAEILNTSFFDNLANSEKQKYLTGIVKMIFSKEFLTPAGIRTRAKSQAFLSDISPQGNQPNSLSDYWDYQGSETSWIVQTGRIAEGLRRQGFYSLSEQLENRILNTVHIFGYNLEYVYVGARGFLENVVAYNIQEKGTPQAVSPQTKIVEIAATNIPEFTQTWTASKVAAILHRRMSLAVQPQTKKGTWQDHLEQETLTQMKNRNEYVTLLRTTEEILQARNNGYLFLVNKEAGQHAEQEIMAKAKNFYHPHS
ncbi:MAG TPA: hypothetical protein VN711_00865 [Candidatus Saccharimonadales bacterium]|nr:hypothetical protein [Candidatus Saccharimonadales bacterium]